MKLEEFDNYIPKYIEFLDTDILPAGIYKNFTYKVNKNNILKRCYLPIKIINLIARFWNSLK